jgi:hypothetical protein
VGLLGGPRLQADEADTAAGGENGGGLAAADRPAADHGDEAAGQVEEEREHQRP